MAKFLVYSIICLTSAPSVIYIPAVGNVTHSLEQAMYCLLLERPQLSVKFKQTIKIYLKQIAMQRIVSIYQD